MTNAIVETFIEAWDALFRKWPLPGNLLKIMLLLGLGYFLYVSVKASDDAQSKREALNDTNFNTDVTQNRQLLEILEAQNKLFSDRLTVLEQRQYDLMKDVTATKEKVETVTDYISPATTGTAQTASTPEVTDPVPASAPAIINIDNIEERSQDITNSIQQLKEQMQGNPDVQETPVQQTQQDPGH